MPPQHCRTLELDNTPLAALSQTMDARASSMSPTEGVDQQVDLKTDTSFILISGAGMPRERTASDNAVAAVSNLSNPMNPFDMALDRAQKNKSCQSNNTSNQA